MIIFAIILVLFLIVICVLNHMYKKTNSYYNSHIMNLDFKEKSIGKIIVVGSTYARFAFEGAKSLRLDVSNLTLQSQSIYNDLKNFQTIKARVKENSLVFIVLAPCTLLFKGNTSELLRFRIPGNPTATLKQKLEYIFPIMRVKRMFRLLSDEGRYFDVYDGKSLINDEVAIDKEMEQLVSLWETMFGLKGVDTPSLSEDNQKCIKENVLLLDKLIGECLEQKCIPVIVVPPFSSRLNNRFSDDFVELVLENNVEKLTNKYPQVKYLNYRKEAVFQENVGLFVDGGFLLNRRGSQLLYKKVSEDITEIESLINKNYGNKK